MNHLHRALAPISDDAWAAIDEEAGGYLRHFLAARKLIDIAGPSGRETPALGTGRLDELSADDVADGVRVATIGTLPMIDLQVRFVLRRDEIRALERGAEDADLDPLRDAARDMAAAEDGLVFDGLASAGVAGMTSDSPHDPLTIPERYEEYPFVVATAVSRLKDAGVSGPYAIALGPDCYQGVIESTEHGGQVVFEHLRKILGGPLVWAPTVNGAIVLSLRGGDYHLQVGQDHSLGYLAHDADTVELYLEETVGFRVDGDEASVALRHAR